MRAFKPSQKSLAKIHLLEIPPVEGRTPHQRDKLKTMKKHLQIAQATKVLELDRILSTSINLHTANNNKRANSSIKTIWTQPLQRVILKHQNSHPK